MKLFLPIVELNYTYFWRSYGDVEVVTIQKTKGNKPPLFAHVSFYSLATVNQVLDGNAKVKFITKGKHLWARRYYPRRNEENKNEWAMVYTFTYY